MKEKSQVADHPFTHKLLLWNRLHNKREMPWKKERDPYKIWLSEVILQQTRVEQGTAYYERFIKEFPRVTDLAAADDEKVMKLWEGLGYYSRCRNLLATARIIAADYAGIFPADYDKILSLKGVGQYTAAAITSFAFDLPYAVVDGNVYRVLSRYFGITTPIDSTVGKKEFAALAQELIDKKNPAAYNQAIMDFGAIVCKPVQPLCNNCILQEQCSAFLSQQVNQLPVKEKKIRMRQRWFHFLLIIHNKKIIVEKRSGKDIWQDLYQFPLVEMQQPANEQDVFAVAEESVLYKSNYNVTHISAPLKQQLSHQKIMGHFYIVQLKEVPRHLKTKQWVSLEELAAKYPFPQLINQFLSSINIKQHD